MNRTTEKILKHLIPLILSLSLLGCQTLPVEVTPRAPTAENTPIPTAASTLTPTPTEVPLEALPVEVLVQKYLAGEIDDVSRLNFEQQKTFSIALNEKKNEQRGANPVIYTDKGGVKFYIDPITGKFLLVDNGTTVQEQTIEMYIPRVIDDENYTHVYHNGEWVKIKGSQNPQFDNFDTFKWPDTKIVDPKWVPDVNLHGLTIPEYLYKAYGEKVNMIPIFFLEKDVGEINIPGFGINGTLMGFVINENNPFSVTAVLITGAPTLYGDNLSAGSTGKLGEVSHFYQKLKTDKLYYLMYIRDQKKEFSDSYPKSNGKEVTTGYDGLVSSNQAHDVITGELNSQNLTLIDPEILVEAGENLDN